MPEILKKRLANLISVKSLVTLALTGVFAYLAIHAETPFMALALNGVLSTGCAASSDEGAA